MVPTSYNVFKFVNFLYESFMFYFFPYWLCNVLDRFYEFPTIFTNKHESFLCTLSSLAHILGSFQNVTNLNSALSQTRLSVKFL
jgi:hypothetical protein